MSKLTDEWGYFTPMPEMVIKMWPKIGTNAVALFLYLRYRLNKDRGVAFPGYKKIREDIGWSYSRIKQAIEELERADLIERKKRYGKTTEYTLTKPPPVAVLDEETASITETVGLDESVPPTSASITETVASVLRKSEDVLKTESTQTELKKSRAKNTRDPLLDHPAIIEYRDEAHLHIPITWRKQVAETVGNDSEEVKRWRAVIHDWIGCGWKKTNVKGMLEVFRKPEREEADPYREVSA